jgi:ABC-type nickel/cobalt efflux system permease component RcnA
MSERKIAMKRWLRLTSLFLLTFVAAWLGVAQTAQSRTATHRIKLRQTTEIQGYSCDKGYTWLYADGKLNECWVSQETQYGDALIPRGSVIYLTPDGRTEIAMLQHNTEIADVKCSGGNWLLGPSEGAMTSFYPSGKLKLCYLAGDQMVQGVPCRHEESILGVAYGIAVKHPNDPDIEFYESGKLKSCTLTKDFGGKRRGEHFQQAQ